MRLSIRNIDCFGTFLNYLKHGNSANVTVSINSKLGFDFITVSVDILYFCLNFMIIKGTGVLRSKECQKLV